MSARNREEGSVAIVAMLVLVALISLGGLTTLSVQGGLATSGHERFRSVALYAAESGAAIGMDFLRSRVSAANGWSDYVYANNDDGSGGPPPLNLEIPGNGVAPGDAGNLFGASMKAWYEIRILNNREDPDYAAGNDNDKRVILQVTGHGPNGTVAQIEWDVKADGTIGLGRPCPTYAEQNNGSDGAGRNDCLNSVDGTQQATFSLN